MYNKLEMFTCRHCILVPISHIHSDVVLHVFYMRGNVQTNDV